MKIKIPQKRKGNFLNYIDLAKLLSKRLGISTRHIELVLKESESLITEILLQGYDISFEFGKLRTKVFKDKNGYDPVHKKHIIKKGRRVIKFSESREIRDILKGKKNNDENK